MKIDVQGSEFLVLKGGEELFKKHNPTIIMEFCNDDLHKKAVNFLLERGYKMYRIDNNGDLNLISNEYIKKIYYNKIKAEANYVFIK